MYIIVEFSAQYKNTCLRLLCCRFVAIFLLFSPVVKCWWINMLYCTVTLTVSLFKKIKLLIRLVSLTLLPVVKWGCAAMWHSTRREKIIRDHPLELNQHKVNVNVNHLGFYWSREKGKSVLKEIGTYVVLQARKREGGRYCSHRSSSGSLLSKKGF